MEDSRVVDLVFEWGLLKRVRHEGHIFAGVDNPETVAAHSLRAAQLAFVLAKMENLPNPLEACAIVVFHDVGECRVGDLHKVARRYVEVDEERAVRDQLDGLDFGEEIFGLWKQAEHKSTPAGIIAKDADYLELAFTSKEYHEVGYHAAQDWLDNISRQLQTGSAKRLFAQLLKSSSSKWWKEAKHGKD